MFSAYSLHRFSPESVDALEQRLAELDLDQVVLMHREGVNSDVILMRDPENGAPILINNGKFEGGEIGGGFAYLGILPYTSHRWRAPPRTLSIGLGSGRTLRALAAADHAQIVSIELSQGILDANRGWVSPDLFEDPRIEHVRMDGRRFLLLDDRQWEIVVVSPSWAVEQASANLLTQEFFALVANRLSKMGVVAIHLDLWLMPDEDVKMVLRGMRESLPHAQGWNIEGGEFVLLGSKAPFEVLEHQQDVVGRYASELGEAKLAFGDEYYQSMGPGRLHTDDKPVLEYNNARHILTGITETGAR